MNPTLDVIIPVYRPDEKLGRLLSSLSNQTKKPDHVIVVHTGPVLPGEPDYTECIFLELAPEKFDHGGARNLGASRSDADLLVFMTQDAVPADDRLLEKLTEALLSDDRAACAYARQLPNPDASYLERLMREFNYPERTEVRGKKDLPTRGIRTYTCSNVCAVYDGKRFRARGGFPTRAIFNEDMIYAAHAVQAGDNVIYQGTAAVTHSHNLSAAEQFHRNFDNGVSQAMNPDIFSGISSESEGKKLLRFCLGRMKNDHRLLCVFPMGINFSARYLGFFLGKRYEKLPKRMVRAFSLNQRFWDKNR